MHAGSAIPSIQACIIKIVKSVIYREFDVNEDQFSLFVFYLEKAYNSHAYHPVLTVVYDKFRISKEKF